MKRDEGTESRLARLRMRAPRPGLRAEILARAAQAKPRRRPWFAYAVTATIVLALLVGQVADRIQSRRLAALVGPMPSVALAAHRGAGEPLGIAAFLQQQAEVDRLLSGPEPPNGGIGG